MTIAASDCERCRPGLVAQPVNAASSLAYVGVGGALARRAGRGRRSERALAWATVAVGLGSVAYHGPGGRLGQRTHDASLLATLGLLVVADIELLRHGREVPPAVLAAVVAGAVAGSAPARSMEVQALAGVAAGAAEVARVLRHPPGTHGPWARRAELPMFAVGAIAHVLGRTGGPLCRPDSRWQPHALWHVLTAATLHLRATDTP
ncbi:MAG: hypothetical protein KF703_16465 [Actinobacteria bacterium]|nr:hypothetical protein [Actinomycetota bacterium]